MTALTQQQTHVPAPRSARRTDVAAPPPPRRDLAMPASIKPMLATHGALPVDGRDWGFEFKWDGMRTLAFWDGRSLRLRSRNDLDATVRYPELLALGEAIGDRRVVLDGEVCALDADDRPSFPRLQKRMRVVHPAVARRLSAEVPVHYFVFDLLHLDGRSTMDLPLVERRDLLEELTLKGPSWELSPIHVDRGDAMLETARLHGLEGVVAKRLDSSYEPGVRSPAWVKVKLVRRQEFVVGGWTTEAGSPRRIGALHVGYYDARARGGGGGGKLHYAGGVGSGLSGEDVEVLLPQLEALRTDASPFDGPLPRRDVTFVRPRVVIEVEYRRWPPGGVLHQSSFKGVRTDKPARDVVREDVTCSIYSR